MNANSNGNGFEQFSAIWRRRKGLMLAVFAIVAVPSVCAVIALPNVYEAEATVIPLGAALQQSSALGGGSSSAFDSVTEQVLSRDRLVALIDKYDLYPDAKPDSATVAMRKDILIQPRRAEQSRGGLPYAFNVIYRGGNAEKVAAVTNNLATSYQTVAQNMQGQAISNAAESLKGRLDLLQKKMDRQQGQIDKYRNEHRGELPEQQDANLAALQRVDRQLRDNDAQQLQLMESRADLVQKMGGTGQSALPELEQRLADLKLRYTDKYPAVIALKQRIKILKAQQPANSGGASSQTPLEQELAKLNSDLAAMQSEQIQLRSQVTKYQQHLDDAPLTAQRLRSLTQGYAETSDLYATLLKTYEQIRIADATSGKGGPQYQVLESAIVPTAPSGPGRLRLLLICLVLGLGLSGLAAVLAEQFDTSFHTLEELQAFTALPVLTTVPAIVTPGDVRRKRLRLGAALVLVLVAVGALGAGATFYTHQNQTLAQKFSHKIGSIKS